MIHHPESSGAVEVAPEALGAVDASVVPRGRARAVPVSSGGLGGRQRKLTPATDGSRSPASDVMEGQRGDRARARPFTGGHRPEDGSCCRQKRGTGSLEKAEPPTVKLGTVKLALPVRLVEDELATEVTADQSLGGLVAKVAVFSARCVSLGPRYSGAGA